MSNNSNKRKNSNQHNSGNGYRKKSRNGGLDSAVHTRALSYNNNAQSNKNPTYTKVEGPDYINNSSRFKTKKDIDTFILQVRPNQKKIPLNDLLEQSINYDVDKFLEALYNQWRKENNKAACEIRGQPYEMRHLMPEDINLQGVTESRKQSVIVQYTQALQAYNHELDQLHDNRAMIIADAISLLDTELKQSVLASFPDYENRPNLIGVVMKIREVYELAHFDGRKEDLDQQVLMVYSEFYNGLTASRNQLKFGEFNLPHHRKVFEKLLGYRKAAGMTDLDPKEQARAFVFSCETIRYLRLTVQEIKSNEYKYRMMPQGTPEQIAVANAYRIMPDSFQSAYDLLKSIKDIGIVYRDELQANNSSSLNTQRPNIQIEKPKKRKHENVSSSDSKTTTTGKFCALCEMDNHNTSACRKLPEAVLALKLQKAEKDEAKLKKEAKSAEFKNKKTKSELGNLGNTQKSNYVYDDPDTDDDDLAFTFVTGSQRSHIYYSSDNLYNDDNTISLDDPYAVQFDNGCSINVQEFKHIKGVTGYRRYAGSEIHIETANGTKIMKNAVLIEVKAFGPCIYNDKAKLNLVSQAYCEKHYKVDVIRQGNITVSYHVHVPQYGVVLKFNRQPGGIYVGSIRELMDKEWKSVPNYYQPVNEHQGIHKSQKAAIEIDSSVDPSEYHTEDVQVINSIVPTKSDVSTTTSAKEKKLYDYALNVLQPNLGFIAPRAFETMANQQMILNVPVPPNAIRKAIDTLGPTTVTVRAKSKIQHKKPHLSNYIQSLMGNDILIEIDLMFVEECVFLLAVSYPGFYCVLSYIGFGSGCKKATSISHHLMYTFSVYKAMRKSIKFVSGDGEKSFHALVTQIQEQGGTWIPLPKGDHPVYVDIMTQKIKNAARAMILDASYDPPRKVLVGVMYAAVYFVNYMPCNGNHKQLSPMMCYLGVPLDYKNHNIIRPMQLFEVKVEDKMTSNTMLPRSIPAIASHPAAQGWYFVNLLTFKLIKSSSFIPRPVNAEIFKELHERRLEERKEIQSKPNSESIVKAVQTKNFDWKQRNVNHQHKTYGVLNMLLSVKKEVGDIIEKKDSFHPVHLEDIPVEHRADIMTTQLLMNPKDKEEETILKSRFVAGGNSQDKSKFDHINDIQSPTVEQSSVFQLLIAAAILGYAIVAIDFPQAFLNALQDRPQYARITKEVVTILCILWPERFKAYVRPDGTILIQLDKALYGQIQAPRLFNKFLVSNLNDMGYVQNEVDLGLFKKVMKDDVVELATHVDDLFAIMPVEYVLTYIKQMKDRFGNDLTVHTNLDSKGKLDSTKEVEYLGMLLSIDYDECYAKINPFKFYHKVCDVHYADLIDDKVKRAPSKADFLEIDDTSPLLKGDEKKRIERLIYQLRYPCFMAPETLFHAAWFVSRISKGITEQDKVKLIHFLRYINGRKALPMLIGPNKDKKIELSVFSDASQGITAYTSTVISCGRGVISVHCHKQKQVQIASAHTELVAAAESTTHALHIQHVMEARGVSEEYYKPCKFFEDNMAVIHLMKNGRSINSKSKHIHIRFFFMKQYFDNGDMQMIHCITEKMVADLNTKPKVGEAFLYLRDRILGYAYIYE